LQIVLVEKVVEVPVEKIVEKVIIDETRVKELEGLLEEERRHTADLQRRVDEVSKNASEAAKVAAEREAEFNAKSAEYASLNESLNTQLRDAEEREALGEWDA
jgi:hypothetical protein